MLSDLVCAGIRWHMEGAALMGELFIQKPDGESITFQVDGTVIKEQKPLEIDWCDKCQKWQPLAFGRHETHDGLKILWFCQDCK